MYTYWPRGVSLCVHLHVCVCVDDESPKKIYRNIYTESLLLDLGEGKRLARRGKHYARDDMASSTPDAGARGGGRWSYRDLHIYWEGIYMK